MKRELLTVRVDHDLKQQYQQVVELMGSTASDHLRQHMTETVQRFLAQAHPPAARQQPAKPHKRKRR